MTKDKQIIKIIKSWLKSNIRARDINTLNNLITDNKNLLRHICDLEKDKFPFYHFIERK